MFGSQASSFMPPNFARHRARSRSPRDPRVRLLQDQVDWQAAELRFVDCRLDSLALRLRHAENDLAALERTTTHWLTRLARRIAKLEEEILGAAVSPPPVSPGTPD